MGYTFPSDYPKDCPPEPRNEELSGTYYRVVPNSNKTDSHHFKSQHELGQMKKLELTEACGRRAVSMFSDYKEAVALSKQVPTLGKYVACLILKGGHGIVHKDHSGFGKTHHDWWIPIGVNPTQYCSEITEARI